MLNISTQTTGNILILPSKTFVTTIFIYGTKIFHFLYVLIYLLALSFSTLFKLSFPYSTKMKYIFYHQNAIHSTKIYYENFIPQYITKTSGIWPPNLRLLLFQKILFFFLLLDSFRSLPIPEHSIRFSSYGSTNV